MLCFTTPGGVDQIAKIAIVGEPDEVSFLHLSELLLVLFGGRLRSSRTARFPASTAREVDVPG